MTIRLVLAELFHADGRTDTTKLTTAFLNFANAPNKRYSYVHVHASTHTQTHIYML